MMSERMRRCGFTLAELLVVVGIIGILVAMLIPAVQMVREAARATDCRNRTRQIALALHNYESANGVITEINGRSYLVDILPYLDQGNLYRKLDFSKGILDPVNEQIFSENPITYFRCPSLPRAHGSSYLGCMGNAWLFCDELDLQSGQADLALTQWHGILGLLKFASVSDGLSNTLMIAEAGSGTEAAYLRFLDVSAFDLDVKTADWYLFNTPIWSHNHQVGGDWRVEGFTETHYNHYLPPNQRSGFTRDGFGVYSSSSYHPGGVNTARGDGSVAFISDSIDRNAWLQLGSGIDGGKQFEGF